MAKAPDIPDPITIDDPVYGPSVIEDPLAIELIHTPTFRRLTGIDQADFSTFPLERRLYPSFDHAVGVHLHLREHRAGRREAIAGLLHGASHALMSKSVAVSKQRDAQGSALELFAAETELPDIIQQSGMNIRNLLDASRFPLLSRRRPNLDALRFDEALRTMEAKRIESRQRLMTWIRSLRVTDAQWHFSSEKHAKDFAWTYLHLNKQHYADRDSAVRTHTMSEYVRYGLEQGYLTESALHVPQDEVLTQLGQYHEEDAELMRLWRRVKGDTKARSPKPGEEAFVHTIQCPSYAIDPLYLEHGTLRAASAEPSLKLAIDRSLEPAEYKVVFEDELPTDAGIRHAEHAA